MEKVIRNQKCNYAPRSKLCIPKKILALPHTPPSGSSEQSVSYVIDANWYMSIDTNQLLD